MSKSYTDRQRALSTSSILKEDDVRKIKARLAVGDSPREIAKDYLVGAETIRRINRGETWAWLTPEQPTQDAEGERKIEEAAAASQKRLEDLLK